MESIYSVNYSKLVKLIPHLFDLQIADSQKSKVSGYMNLNLDVLDTNNKYIVIALSHYYKLNDDLVADPDMEIKIYRTKMVEALTYQDTYSYQVVYPEPGKVRPKTKKALNNFLGTWLSNCINQGHSFKRE